MTASTNEALAPQGEPIPPEVTAAALADIQRLRAAKDKEASTHVAQGESSQDA